MRRGDGVGAAESRRRIVAEQGADPSNSRSRHAGPVGLTAVEPSAGG
ncbi:hypothetical protein [Natronococcus jeotgali]|nr:hypothetical protein [Natronococcus jeotgali]